MPAQDYADQLLDSCIAKGLFGTTPKKGKAGPPQPHPRPHLLPVTPKNVNCSHTISNDVRYVYGRTHQGSETKIVFLFFDHNIHVLGKKYENKVVNSLKVRRAKL